MEAAALYWPRYIEKSWRERTLCYMSDSTLITEENEQLPFASYIELVGHLFAHNLLTFVRDFSTLLVDALGAAAQIFCTEQGKAIAVRIKGTHNRTRWLVNAATWTDERLSVEWLKTLRSVFTDAKVGVHPTPGALGQAIMRDEHSKQFGDEWHHKRHRRPPQPYCERIREESSGARSDAVLIGQQFDLAYELDQHNAYGAALAQRQPTGKTVKLFFTEEIQSTTCLFFFVKCQVQICAPLVLGPFPVRVHGRGRTSRPTFPTQPGTYTTWLWGEEIEVARTAGCTVTLQQGYGWREATTDFASFVERIARLREQAEPDAKPYFKLALVAAIGRFGMSNERYVLAASRKDGDKALCLDGQAYDFWIHQVRDDNPQTMPHIFSHTLMLCRLALYEQALPYAEKEWLISTNTDGLIITSDTPQEHLPQGKATGQWDTTILHNVRVPANRHVISDEKIRLPGVPKRAILRE